MRPVLIERGDCLAAHMRDNRERRGLSQPDVDDAAGFPDGYTAKLEAPHRGARSAGLWGMTTFADYWLRALNLRLVLMDAADAEALIAASAAPALEGATPRTNVARDGGRSALRRTVLRTRLTFLHT